MDEDLEQLTRNELLAKAKKLRAGIRQHRDSTDHELCWHHPELWELLPEKVHPDLAVPAWPQFLRGCLRYRESLDAQLPNAPRVTDEFEALLRGRDVPVTATKYHHLTAVLVHAAWADASSWNKVILRLQRLGLRVRSAQIPLTSMADDVAALKRLLRQVEGPVLLAGHSYAGAVITAAATDDPQVKALVYIAAIVPDEGETVGTLFHRAPPHPSAPQLTPDGDGFLWLPPGAFAKAVAPDASTEETAIMDVTQNPIALRCLGEPMTAPAWKQKPSWFLIAERDRMISPATQRFMAERIRARIHSLPVDHAPLASAPESVVRVIVEAADAIV